MASAGSTLSKLTMGTGTAMDSPATQSIIPLNTRAALLLNSSKRGRPNLARTRIVRLSMLASSICTRTPNSRLASQLGRDTDRPIQSPNATNRHKAPTAEAIPGTATGNRSGMASKPNQTSRCRALSPMVSANVPPKAATCVIAILSTAD